MLITLSRRTATCQSVAEVSFTGVAPLVALSQRVNYFFILIRVYSMSTNMCIYTRTLFSFFQGLDPVIL